MQENSSYLSRFSGSTGLAYEIQGSEGGFYLFPGVLRRFFFGKAARCDIEGGLLSELRACTAWDKIICLIFREAETTHGKPRKAPRLGHRQHRL